MNIQEKKLIESFLQKENSTTHNKAISLLFWGKDVLDANGKKTHSEWAVTRAIKNAVRKCYSGISYAGRWDELYSTFVSLFYQYLMNMNPDKFTEIEDLPSWMFRVATNFANSHRKKIDEILVIEDNVLSISSSKNDGSLPLNENNTNITDSVVTRRKIPTQEDEEESDCQEDSSKWAEDLIAYYISQIQHEYYRTVLYAIDIYGMSITDFAEEQGKKVSAIHNDHKRAMMALIQAALPDIRWRAKKLFDRFACELTLEETATLSIFFSGLQGDIQAVVLAYNKLRKISKRETAYEENELRSQRRYAKQ